MDDLELKDLLPAITKIQAAVDERFKKLDTEQAVLKSQLLEIEQKQVAKVHSDPGSGSGRSGLDLSMLATSPSLQAFQAKSIDRTERIPLAQGIKALIGGPGLGDSSDAMYPVMPDRVPGLQGFTLRPLTLLDFLPSVPTSSNRVEFVQIEWDGQAEAQTVEGEEKAELGFVAQLVDAPVATIACHTTLSAQCFDDVADLQRELSRIMTFEVRKALELEVVSGDGTTGHLDGLFGQAEEFTPTVSAVPEQIGEAITAMVTEGFTPNVIVMHPNDWFDISNLKDDIGEYLYGNPASPAQPTLYNLPVLRSPAMSQGRVLIGDTAQSPLRDRMQPTVFISRDHKDYRTRNLVLILVELRAALTVLNTRAWRKLVIEAVSG